MQTYIFMKLIPFSHVHPDDKNRMNTQLIDWVAKHQEPLVWLNGWKPGCVNVGAGQRVEVVVDVAEATKQGLIVVQRQGGGGTMYLSEDGEVSWAIIAPKAQLPEDINDIYKEICGRIVKALATIGITAHHKPINDVATENGKISGSTVRKTKGVTYVGGTLLYSINREQMWSVLYPNGVDDKGRNKNSLRLTSVQEESGATKEELISALTEGLTQDEYTSIELGDVLP